MKPLPPFGRAYLDHTGSSGPWVAIGPGAWDFAKRKPFPVMVLPLGEDSTRYAWPVAGQSVLLFEMLLNAGSLFNHANLRLPPWLDRALRFVVVTPDMHRVHHSASGGETNTDFGFTFPWWDHLCGTYRAQPAAGHEAMTVGLTCFRDPKYLRLDRTLLQPLFDGDGSQGSLSDRSQNQPAMRSLSQRD